MHILSPSPWTQSSSVLFVWLRKLLAVGFLAGWFCTALAQQPGGDIQEPLLAEPNDCVTQAAGFHKVNALVLRAIFKVESNFNPNAINRNSNGTVDVGIGQHNSIHFAELRKFGIAPSDLLDVCVASYVAAWHLAKQVRVYGNSWQAIGAYHSITPCFNTRYASLVRNALVDWRIVPGPRSVVTPLAACKRNTSVPLARQAQTSTLLAYD